MFDAALASFRVAIGDKQVVTVRDELTKAETATFATSQRVLAILRPGTRAEVQACVRIAAAKRTPLYTVSRGYNWGYGSRVPVVDHCVLMELRRLDRIIDFDEDLGTMTVEPGVTFRQAYEFLKARRSRRMLSVPSTTPEASLVGNAMERGLGRGMGADRCANICALEVVLGNGEVLETGFGRFPNARSAHVHRWGVGPSLDGLFSQSNLGVVTRMTQWLEQRPPHVGFIDCQLADTEALARWIDGIRELWGARLVMSANASNAFRTMSRSGQRPVDPDRVGPGASRSRMGWWTSQCTVSAASSLELYARLRTVARVLKACGDIRVFGEGRRMVAQLLRRPLLMATGVDAVEAYEASWSRDTLGVPTTADLRSAYWQKRTPPPNEADMDLDRDRCGVLWCAPVVPLRGRDVREVVQMIEQHVEARGFEPAITVRSHSERSSEIVCLLAYDRNDPAADERARTCHEDLIDSLIAAGWFPYRLTIDDMKALPRTDTHSDFVHRIRSALDPHGIMAPGRYE